MNAPENVTDYWKIAQVKRDICFLYHELSEYSHIMGDLDYPFYSLPYWKYLSCDSPYPDDEAFIREGCLVMLLAMAWDQIDGSGFYINDKIQTCKRYISYMAPDDERTIKLIDTVNMALDAAETGQEPGSLATRSQWVHVHYIRGYFQRKTHDFETNPYFKAT